MAMLCNVLCLLMMFYLFLFLKTSLSPENFVCPMMIDQRLVSQHSQ
uniref:Uncharacterized protein n=1 Tax=Setaria viridis TaxID=4556 RepID=A0A4U6WEQ1_SETVI|nr:hypothetical protein SEVIR_1G259350v2 [Setaria viridis]